MNPVVALLKADKGTSKTLQLRIVRKLTVTKKLHLDKVLVSSGKTCSQLPKVPLQGFFSTPVRFLQLFFATSG
jgi:hypothetical protein